MAAPFEIVTTPEKRFLRLTLRGQWDDAIFDVFASAYLRAVAEIDRFGGVAYSLVDTHDYEHLTPDLAGRFPALIKQTLLVPMRRTALVVPQLVNKVQAHEVGELLNTRYFRTVEAATDWLFGGEA